MRWGFITSLIIALIITVFAILNGGIVQINFLFTKVNISLGIIIILSVIVGAVIAVLLSLKREFTLNRLKKEQMEVAEKFREENLLLKKRIDTLLGNKQEPCEKETASDKENKVK